MVVGYAMRFANFGLGQSTFLWPERLLHRGQHVVVAVGFVGVIDHAT